MTPAATKRTIIDADVLNLGCGRDYRENAHNVDVAEAVPADEHVDLQDVPWPWPDNAFQRILAIHVLEHLNPVPWEELERVLAPGGRLQLAYPIGHTRFEDASHQQYWNVNTAEWIAGDRKHGHERDTQLELRDVSVSYDITPADWWLEWKTKYKLWQHGPGPWLSQVTGLYGEVQATYELTRGGNS